MAFVAAPLDQNRPLFAQRSILVMGRSFVKGDLVPWKQLGVAQARLRALFRMCFLAHESPIASREKATTNDVLKSRLSVKPSMKPDLSVVEPPLRRLTGKRSQGA